ncbi:hypothetical protein B0H16DRAFT_1824336 [Mycena metata]|uniref:Uncharacterized protein n=1 Tax=Mycena metata TaxID=1033252 RepID=A0AAD7M9S9_9AGAR|nr:hypothetical protein B0H16DRAFT_1824336 [Mycena metata]
MPTKRVFEDECQSRYRSHESTTTVAMPIICFSCDGRLIWMLELTLSPATQCDPCKRTDYWANHRRTPRPAAHPRKLDTQSAVGSYHLIHALFTPIPHPAIIFLSAQKSRGTWLSLDVSLVVLSFTVELQHTEPQPEATWRSNGTALRPLYDERAPWRGADATGDCGRSVTKRRTQTKIGTPREDGRSPLHWRKAWMRVLNSALVPARGGAEGRRRVLRLDASSAESDSTIRKRGGPPQWASWKSTQAWSFACAGDIGRGVGSLNTRKRRSSRHAANAIAAGSSAAIFSTRYMSLPLSFLFFSSYGNAEAACLCFGEDPGLHDPPVLFSAFPPRAASPFTRDSEPRVLGYDVILLLGYHCPPLCSSRPSLPLRLPLIPIPPSFIFSSSTLARR